MGSKDPRADDFVARWAPFARPILWHLCGLVHESCPEVRETMKWSHPHFEYKGLLASMAAFKRHCSFRFWKASLLADPERILERSGAEGMGHLGRITGLADLPPHRIFLAYLREAVRLDDSGLKAPRAKASAKGPMRMPLDLAAALDRDRRARATFEGLSRSHKREYIE